MKARPPKPSLEGNFLVATPAMRDDRFQNTVVYLVAHGEEGAMGVVINRPVGNLTLNGLLDRLSIAKSGNFEGIIIHKGGPVEPERGFVLHSDDYRQKSTVPCQPSMGLTTTLEIVKDIAQGRGPRQFLFALGYAGWAGSQLEEELRRDSWLSVPALPEMIFSTDWRDKWTATIRHMGLDIARLAGESGNA